MKKYSDFCFYAQLLFEVGGYCFIKSYVATDGQFKSWNNIFCYLLCNVKSKLKIALKSPFSRHRGFSYGSYDLATYFLIEFS